MGQGRRERETEEAGEEEVERETEKLRGGERR